MGDTPFREGDLGFTWFFNVCPGRKVTDLVLSVKVDLSNMGTSVIDCTFVHI